MIIKILGEFTYAAYAVYGCTPQLRVRILVFVECTVHRSVFRTQCPPSCSVVCRLAYYLCTTVPYVICKCMQRSSRTADSYTVCIKPLSIEHRHSGTEQSSLRLHPASTGKLQIKCVHLYIFTVMLLGFP